MIGVIFLTVIVLSHIMWSGIEVMLNLLSGIMPSSNGILLCVIMLNVVMLCVIMLNVDMLCVIMLNVVMLCVIMLNVVML